MRDQDGKGAIVSTVASLASLAAALSCCLPLGSLLMAAGSAGASLFAERLRPWLLLFSVAFLVLAFAQTYLGKRCEFRYRRFRTVLLWFSIAVVGAMLAAPQATSRVLAGHLPSFSRASALADFDAQKFVREFDAASAQTRMVVLLSPT